MLNSTLIMMCEIVTEKKNVLFTKKIYLLFKCSMFTDTSITVCLLHCETQDPGHEPIVGNSSVSSRSI